MKRIAVVHYMPLEFYPPVTNFLNSAGSNSNLEIKVWTTHNNKNRELYTNDLINSISRAQFPDLKDNKITRLFKYGLFNLKCILGLLFYNPDKILYYESYSVWPVYWYLKIFNKQTEVFIHYHEYSSPDWYKKGMRLVYQYHNLEKKLLYKKACWISQTNEDRINLFLKDNSSIGRAKMKVLPNYPPMAWSEFFNADKSTNQPLKTVYIGSLSLESTYIKEYCEWIISQKGKVLFDIYAFNLHEDTVMYLSHLNSQYIRFYQKGIEYDAIPQLLGHYDIGLILYKALTDNYKFNAPNKLFEYLVCGLQVWYSDKMLGIKPYESSQVIAVDFENINAFDFTECVNSTKSNKKNTQFTAEEALLPLIKQLEL